MMRTSSLCAVLALGGGCFSAELDDQAADAFACGPDVGNAPCPAEQTCSVGRCRDNETLPVATIGGPLNGDFIDFVPGNAAVETIVEFSVNQPFTVVDPESKGEHVFGEGHIVIAVDGVEQGRITNGNVSGGREIPISIPNTVGAHRISIELFGNDGEPYDHRTASARNLFWLRDGTPRVAVTRPWPGEIFSLDEQTIDVEIGVIDFEVIAGGAAPMLRRGHAHVHYDDPFPECPVSNDGCDGGYIVIANSPIDDAGRFGVPSAGNTARLPRENAARDVEVTGILRNVDHRPYFLPDQDPNDENFVFPSTAGDVVFDTVTIQRQ